MVIDLGLSFWNLSSAFVKSSSSSSVWPFRRVFHSRLSGQIFVSHISFTVYGCLLLLLLLPLTETNQKSFAGVFGGPTDHNLPLFFWIWNFDWKKSSLQININLMVDDFTTRSILRLGYRPSKCRECKSLKHSQFWHFFDGFHRQDSIKKYCQ